MRRRGMRTEGRAWLWAEVIRLEARWQMAPELGRSRGAVAHVAVVVARVGQAGAALGAKSRVALTGSRQ